VPLRSRTYGRGLMERRQLDERAATIRPISFAIGIAVLLVGMTRVIPAAKRKERSSRLNRMTWPF
jgi:hypothetical protein